MAPSVHFPPGERGPGTNSFPGRNLAAQSPWTGDFSLRPVWGRTALPGKLDGMGGFRPTCDHLATPRIAPLARPEAIDRDQRCADHAPITVEYEPAPG
ncbi:hypothetical protein GCM10028796_57080 [Ramlibacter monticola]